MVKVSQNATNSSVRERGTERNRRAVLTGGVALLARAVQIGTSLITVPLTLKYLGNERFGLWMTISSVLAMAAFADFGMGNGVLNNVAKAFGQDDMEGVRKTVSSGFALLNSIAIFLMLSFFAIYRFVNWADFFRVVSPQARSEAGPVLAVFATCLALNISMDVVQRVQLGLQQGYRYGLWQLSGSMAGLIGVLGGIWLRVSLPVLVVAIAGAPVFSTTLNTIHFFGFVRPDLRPRWELVSTAVVVQIAKLGGLFFVLQVVIAASFSADNLIIDRIFGAVSVPEYSIPQRMFALIGMLLITILHPLWPAYGESISRHDIAWVRHTLRRSLLIVFTLSFIASSLLLLLAPKLIYLWVGARIHPPFLLLLGLAVWSVMESCSNSVNVFLNGAVAVRFQISVSVTFGVVCVIMKVLLTRHFGLVAVPWSTIISCVLVQVLPWVFFIPRFLKHLESKSKSNGLPDRLNYPLAVPETGE
jgi:O-antigen/teichoic acid export membrane protein